MLFSLQVKGYKGIIAGFKVLSKVLPIPKPTLFTGPGSSLELCASMAHMGTKKVLIFMMVFCQTRPMSKLTLGCRCLKATDVMRC